MFLNFLPVSLQLSEDSGTGRAACCVKAGLRAFAEKPKRDQQSFLTHLFDLSDYPQKASQDSLRVSRPRMECSGLQGTVICTVKHAHNLKQLKGTNSILSMAS